MQNHLMAQLNVLHSQIHGAIHVQLQRKGEFLPDDVAESTDSKGIRFLHFPDSGIIADDVNIVYLNSEYGMTQSGWKVDLQYLINNQLKEVVTELDAIALR